MMSGGGGINLRLTALLSAEGKKITMCVLDKVDPSQLLHIWLGIHQQCLQHFKLTTLQLSLK
jgi:hypothetical protein